MNWINARDLPVIVALYFHLWQSNRMSWHYSSVICAYCGLRTMFLKLLSNLVFSEAELPYLSLNLLNLLLNLMNRRLTLWF